MTVGTGNLVVLYISTRGAMNKWVKLERNVVVNEFKATLRRVSLASMSKCTVKDNYCVSINLS